MTARPSLIALFLAAGLVMQTGHAAPPPDDIPPPPGLDEPGVTTAAEAPPPAESADAATADDPLAPLPRPDSRLVRDRASRGMPDAHRVAASEVTTRQVGEDTVEEFRDAGRLWMIRITPARGPAQIYMDTDGSGRLAHDPRDGPVAPVYYTLYEWK